MSWVTPLMPSKEQRHRFVSSSEAHLAGLAIDLTCYDDGLFELSVEIDPANKIKETDDNATRRACYWS
jgi:negative regulator of sigma E activity